jgi:protein-S-isoprenylcysteine O-methyltransferase Ste14
MPDNSGESGPGWPLAKTAFFFAIVPGTVAGYLPYSMLQRRGLWLMPEIGAAQALGALLILLGAAGLLWCGWHFAVTGLGTPAPFDPPRRLVARGPYRYVRNPMYVTVATALIGESLFFETWLLAGYLAFFWLTIHLFVLLYEEPTLRGKFGESYEEYLRAVPRWIPRPPRKQ